MGRRISWSRAARQAGALRVELALSGGHADSRPQHWSQISWMAVSRLAWYSPARIGWRATKNPPTATLQVNAHTNRGSQGGGCGGSLSGAHLDPHLFRCQLGIDELPASPESMARSPPAHAMPMAISMLAEASLWTGTTRRCSKIAKWTAPHVE